MSCDNIISYNFPKSVVQKCRSILIVCKMLLYDAIMFRRMKAALSHWLKGTHVDEKKNMRTLMLLKLDVSCTGCQSDSV